MISNKDIKQHVLSIHQIILDLTSCGPPQPFDLSTAPPPTTEPTTYNTDTPTESPSAPPPPSEPNPTTSTGSEPTANTSLISSVSGTTCNAMHSIANYINNRGTLNLNCVALNCIEIHCAGNNTTLNLSLSCSPIGMILGTADNTTLFSQSGVFAGHIQLTVHNYNDTVLGFGLRVYDSNVPLLDQQTVNYTLIPLYVCNESDYELDSESKSLNCEYNSVLLSSSQWCPYCRYCSSCCSSSDVCDCSHLDYSGVSCSTSSLSSLPAPSNCIKQTS